MSFPPPSRARDVGEANPNTVQLGGQELDCWWVVVGLGTILVVSSFDLPLGHFAFDESRVGSSSPWRVEPLGEHMNDVMPEAVRVVRGKNRVPVQSSGARDEGPQRS